MPKFNKTQFFGAIEQIAEQNLLTINEMNTIIDEAVQKSFHSKFDPDAELELVIDAKKQIFELINHSKYIVNEKVDNEYRAIEINIEDAKKINKNAKIGNKISEVVEFESYSRSIAQLIRQLITQNVKEKRKKAIYAKHKGLKGEMIEATVTSVSPNYAIVSLNDGTTAFMPSKFKNPKIKLAMGEKTRVYVEDVLEESKDAQIIVSNGSKILVKRILEIEVPEVSDGIVEIISISRIPGERSKVAVKSTNPVVDAVGAIIGAEGTRIKKIIEKLDGEKIDVIQWSEDKNLFIANSLSPAKVISILEKKDDEGNVIKGHVIAITPNQHQTLAIGKSGSNAKLSVELTNTRIDVISINEANAQGIKIIWNGNIEESELELIESGIRTKRRKTRTNHSNHGFSPNNHFMDTEDDDIRTFHEQLVEEPIQKDTEFITDDYELPEDDLNKMELPEDDLNKMELSEDDLNKMQAEFEFDDYKLDDAIDEEVEKQNHEEE